MSSGVRWRAVARAALLLQALGHQLGRLHRAGPGAEGLAARRPWVLDLRQGRLPAILAGDPELAALASRIQASPGLVGALDELATVWEPEVPLHGDVKLDNVLVGGDGAPPWLVDWELCGRGLPEWDLAGVTTGLALPALVVQDEADIQGELALAQAAMDGHRRATRGAPPIDADRLAAATTARLIQAAVQLCAMRHDFSEHALSAERVLAGAERSAGARSPRREVLSCTR